MLDTSPTLVFDLDGTLVDSAPDLVGALNVVLEREKVAPLPYEIARGFVGGGGRVLIRRGLEAAGREVSDARLEEMFSGFIAHYEDHLAERTRFFDGAEAALDRLAAAGHRLAVLTNKYERLARKLLDALGASRRFATIAGQDSFPVAKPNGAVLRLTVAKAGGDPEHAILIGDTKTDVDTARDAGCPSIAVDFGYSQTPVSKLGADRIVSRFADLDAAVAAVTPAVADVAPRRAVG